MLARTVVNKAGGIYSSGKSVMRNCQSKDKEQRNGNQYGDQKSFYQIIISAVDFLSVLSADFFCFYPRRFFCITAFHNIACIVVHIESPSLAFDKIYEPAERLMLKSYASEIP